MYASDDDYKTLFGMLAVWKQLPAILVEIVAITCVSLQFGIPWSIGITIAIAAPISFLKFGLINNKFLIFGAIYAKWLKWPVRIAALLLVGSYPPNAWYLGFMFLWGAKLVFLPWDALVDRFISYSISGQLLEYRALELIGERCARLPMFAQPLMDLPLKLPTGESFDQVSQALIEAGNIENTDPQRYAAIVSAATKILGKEHAERMIKIFVQLESEELASEQSKDID